MTLFHKISLTIFSVTLITIGAVGAVVFTTTRAALQDAISENQLEVTRQTMDKIDRLLYERYLDILAISEDEGVELFLEGQEGIKASENLRKEFRKNTILTGPWEDLFAVDLTGTIVLSTHDEDLGKNIEENIHAKTALKEAQKGRVYYSDLVLSAVTGKPAVVFAAPVRSEAPGRPIVGFVMGDFTWPVVLEILEELSVEASLYNAQGLLIGSSDPDESSNHMLRDDSRRPIVENALMGGEESVLFSSSTQDEVSVLASYVPQLGYLNYKGSEWRLIVEVPSRVAFAAAQKDATRFAITVGILNALSAILLFVVVNRNVVVPVAALTKTASVITQGDLKVRAKVHSKDEIGKLAASFNAMTDSLLEARELPENIIRSLQDGLIALDETGKIELVNPRIEKMFKTSKSDILGKTIEDLQNIAGFETFVDLMREEHGRLLRKELSLPRGVTLEVTAEPIGKSGEIIVFHDITREKRVERLKSEFVSIAAHQLRTPLSAVKWAIQLFLEEKVKMPKDSKELIFKAYESNERMITLVNDLLSVARIEEGKYMHKPVLGLMEEVAESSLRELKQSAKRAKVEIVFRKPSKRLPLVLVDVEAMKLVIQNLVENALQYTPAGGKVRVSLLSTKRTVEVSVEDTGIGVEDEERERLFTKFFRGRKATQMKTEGSGLGLFIVKNIIEAHQGAIWFDSKPGKGTTFHFSIPIDSINGDKGGIQDKKS